MHTPSHFLKPEENQISVDSDQEVIHSELICVIMKVTRYSTHNCEIISTLYILADLVRLEIRPRSQTRVRVSDSQQQIHRRQNHCILKSFEQGARNPSTVGLNLSLCGYISLPSSRDK